MAPAIRIWCCWNNKDKQAALEQSGYIIDFAHSMFQCLETGGYIHYIMTLNVTSIKAESSLNLKYNHKKKHCLLHSNCVLQNYHFL